MRGTHVVVAGGGLAGISAAVEASARGARVTLVERRPFLGGKTFSFTEPRTGVQIDNGQHVHLGCCTAYMHLLSRLGSIGLTRIQPALHVDVRDRTGRHGVLSARRLPPPLHMGPSFARYGRSPPSLRSATSAATPWMTCRSGIGSGHTASATRPSSASGTSSSSPPATTAPTASPQRWPRS
jgi:uncharacterized protein with NAD-binding domain and iron-sulfur cluster